MSGDILTSTWSELIHQPAEDSEPEDLPSTVDMDALKVIAELLRSSVVKARMHVVIFCSSGISCSLTSPKWSPSVACQ